MDLNRIWRLGGNPAASDFAYAGGDWKRVFPSAQPCRSCGRMLDGPRVSPLVFTWEDSSVRVGDFVWAPYSSAVVTEHAVSVLVAAGVTGFSTAEVVVEPPKPRKLGKLYPAASSTPPLVELVLTAEAAWDSDRSTVEREVAGCGLCRVDYLAAIGVEKLGMPVVNRDSAGYRVEPGPLQPRDPHDGIFIREEDLDAAGLFRLRGFGVEPFCTDRVRRVIEDAALTNVWFFEWGEVLRA